MIHLTPKFPDRNRAIWLAVWAVIPEGIPISNAPPSVFVRDITDLDYDDLLARVEEDHSLVLLFDPNVPDMPENSIVCVVAQDAADFTKILDAARNSGALFCFSVADSYVEQHRFHN